MLAEGPAGSTDEGQALAELIHRTAPGAQLYFYTADVSEQGFAAGIAALTAAGCQVIVDDIVWEDEPFFQIAGPVDTAAAQAVAAGVAYFSAAGNEGGSFFQGAFTPTSIAIQGVGTVTAEQFPGGAAFQTISIPAGQQVTVSLQWTAPYAAANPATLTIYAVSPGGQVITSFQPGQEPAALLNLPTAAAAQSWRIYVALTPGTTAPSQFKYVLEGGGTLSGAGVGVGGGSIIGHDLVPGVNAVGAVNVANTPAEGGAPTPEPYSATGPGQLWLAPDGTQLAAPRTLAAPAFLAPDGASTSVFAPFLGTSAAAGEAAAVAALMLQADGALANADLSTLLADSAIPAGAASVAGAGLIQANLAVGFAATRDIAGSPQATVRGISSQACTVTGGAATQELIAGSAPTLLQSQGSDSVVAGAGADTVDLTGPAAVLFGSSGSLLVRTMAGSDTVAGGAGSVTVAGGSGGGMEFGSAAGDNALTAGDAPTLLVQGGAGDTLAAAGGGNDTLVAAGTGAATLLGGGASGNVFAALGSGPALILTGAGVNVVFLTDGADTVVGGTGPVVLQAGAGAQLAFGGSGGGNYLAAGSGADHAGRRRWRRHAGGCGRRRRAGGGGLRQRHADRRPGAETLVGSSGGGAVNLFRSGAAAAVIAPGTAPAVVELGQRPIDAARRQRQRAGLLRGRQRRRRGFRGRLRPRARHGAARRLRRAAPRRRWRRRTTPAATVGSACPTAR